MLKFVCCIVVLFLSFAGCATIQPRQNFEDILSRFGATQPGRQPNGSVILCEANADWGGDIGRVKRVIETKAQAYSGLEIARLVTWTTWTCAELKPPE